jgi:uncharacterized protein (DUF1697 family)
MATFVALLRGVNVGSHNRIAMADVRAAVGAAGYENVTTLVQSGNVVLTGRGKSASAVGATIEAALRNAMNLDVDVMVRTSRDLATIAAAHPFIAPRIDPKFLHVGFLKAKPAAGAVRTLGAADFGPDRFALRGTELYLHYGSGQGRSKMTAAFFERTLGIPMTMRNWNVVTKLDAMARA